MSHVAEGKIVVVPHGTKALSCQRLGSFEDQDVWVEQRGKGNNSRTWGHRAEWEPAGECQAIVEGIAWKLKRGESVGEEGK